MKATIVTLGVWLWLMAAGFGGYYLWTRVLPKSVIDIFQGFKTKTVGVIIAISPDIINFLGFVQLLGSDWAPSDTVTWVMRGVGTTITLLRYITDHENDL